MNNTIKTTDELIVHLKKLGAAYRKSYKFCGRVNTVLQVTSGVIGCSAVLALVPAIPVFVTFVGAVPPAVTVLLNKLKISEKKSILKIHHHKIKQILSQACIETAGGVEETKVIANAFSELMKIQKEETYTTPFEMYMKEYKLNGYE